MIVRPRPCGTCPYALSTPSGVWHFDEYEKLREYDKPTGEQPAGGFRCHRTPETYCAGWAVTHTRFNPPGHELLAFRINPPEHDVPTVSDVFISGNAAADYGQQDIEQPSAQAKRAIERLIQQNPDLEPPPASWCCCHHRYEEVPDDVYRVCFECGHVYATAADLVNDYNQAAAEVIAPDDPALIPPVKDLSEADDIFFCQHCIHDF